jgi:hypothetical protein
MTVGDDSAPFFPEIPSPLAGEGEDEGVNIMRLASSSMMPWVSSWPITSSLMVKRVKAHPHRRRIPYAQPIPAVFEAFGGAQKHANSVAKTTAKSIG